MEIAGIFCTAKSLKTRDGFAPGRHGREEPRQLYQPHLGILPHQMVLHDLFKKVAAAEFGCGVRSLRAKKWADARAYADRLMAECDACRGA